MTTIDVVHIDMCLTQRIAWCSVCTSEARRSENAPNGNAQKATRKIEKQNMKGLMSNAFCRLCQIVRCESITDYSRMMVLTVVDVCGSHIDNAV